MTSRLKNRALDLSRSLGAVPGLIVVVFAALGIGLVELDRRANIGQTDWVFQGDAAAARTVLSVIAGSLITVAGLTFSMTMVALQLASSQFSPRILRTFFGDRITQITIGTYVGVFVYAVLVLRAVGSFGTEGFIPRLSVTAASLLGIGAVVLLVVFLSHVSKLIQVSHVTAAIAGDTLERIDKLLPDPFEDAADDRAAELLDEWREEPSATVLAGHPGYVQRLGLEDLTKSLPPSVERVAMVVCPGDFVAIDIAIAEIWPADALDACRSTVLESVSVTTERDLNQDVDFGVRQLTDIALKAVSPGINDPATAVTCINYLRSILVRLTERAPPPRLHCYPERGLTVIVRHREYHEYFESLEQINRYVGPDAWVIEEMLQALAACARAARRHGGNARADAVRDVVATVQERAHSEVVHRRDRRQIDATFAAIDREAEEPLPHLGSLGKNS